MSDLAPNPACESSSLSTSEAPGRAAQTQPRGLTMLGMVEVVWPQFGIAYVRGAAGQEWAVTVSTPNDGTHLDELQVGDRLQLRLDVHSGASLVTHYARTNRATTENH